MSIDKLIAKMWTDSLLTNGDPVIRRQLLRASLIANLNTRFFESHGDMIRVGHRRWDVSEPREEVK